MSNEQQKTFLPSAEHRWGLYRVSQKKAWVGLTEREFTLIYELNAKKNPEDWLMWVAGQNEWKKLNPEEKNWNCFLPEFPADLPQPPKKKKGFNE